MHLTEPELIAGLREGREKVFEMLFRTHYPALCRYAYSFLNDGNEAEEVVQTVFVVLWEKRTRLAVEQSLKSYLFRMVRNSSLNRIKHMKVVRLHASDLMASGEPTSESASQPVEASELELRISEAVGELPEQCRRVFQLVKFEEMSYAEASAELGISVKTVENQMGKALRLMRDRLKEFLPAFLIATLNVLA